MNPMMLNDYLYQGYRTRTFSQVFQEFDEFNEFYNDCGIETTITETSLQNLYYLLMSRYANSPVASSDEGRFKYNVMSIIFQYGPTWERRLAIQKSLRQLSDADLFKGSMTIYNHASNPSTAPSTGDETALLSYINDQTVTHNKKGIIDAYAQLNMLLDDDVTGEFLGRFKTLFNNFMPEVPIKYYYEEDDDNE